jgi:type II secretion system protein N
MTKAALWVRRAGFFAAVLILFLLFSYILFPTARIDAVITQVLAEQGLTLTPAVHKTILPGFAWDDMQLSSEQGVLLGCQRLQVRPLLLPLFIGRAVFSGKAVIGQGRLEAKYALNGKDALDLGADGITLADVPFFKTVLGAKIAGNLWIQGKLMRSPKGLNGDLKLEIKQLGYSGVKLGAFPLPDAANLKTQGMLKFSDGKARLESFTLEGEGVYMRLSGDVPTGANAAVTPINMSLAIMPKPEFLEKQKLVFMLLAKFMTAPGVYTVPIRGTLLKPTIL